MKILLLGDVVGAPGREVVAQRLPAFRVEQGIDFTVINAENVVDGSGVNRASFRVLRSAGANVCTTGDHVYKRADILKLFKLHPDEILRPANYPPSAAGRGWCVHGDVAVINLIGRVFLDGGDDPFRVVDEILEQIDASIILVDMHAEATSEKRAMGFFLDGRVTAVVGTHTHVPTADEEILPKGTAYVTDLGMCGAYRSVIGRQIDPVLYRFRTRMYAPFGVAEEDVRATGVVVDVDEETGKARSIERVTLRMEE
ncbi:MAG: TIGR00282 family metallophosphoesterase [Planctomycetota bacterium]